MPPRRKCALEELIRVGFVANGELLRYKSKHGQLMAVGRAREGGIEVAGVNKLLGYTAFEDVSGSKYHRPAEHTHTLSGRSLQSLSLLAAGAGPGSGGARGKAKEALEPAEELLEDDNDDLCHICGLGGDLMCCETCPGVFHAVCLGLVAPPEGEYFCPLCKCTACGVGGSEGVMPTGCDWLDCSCFVAPEQLVQCSRPHITEEAARSATAASPAAAETESAAAAPAGECGTVPAAAAADEAGGAQAMQVDGQPAAPPPPTADLSQLAAAACSTWQAAATPAEAAGAMAGAATAPDSAAVPCPIAGCWTHLRCFPPEFAQQLRQGTPRPCISSQDAVTASRRLAAACAAGLIPLGSVAQCAAPEPDEAVSGGGRMALPLSLLVVRGAAAACPRDCRGHAPAYTPQQRQSLRLVLSAALHVVHSCYAPLPDSRTGEDMLPWLLRGAVMARGKVDYSGVHTALLYVGQSMVAAAVFRSFGDLAEVPVLAVRPELQKRNGLGGLLLAAVEQLLLLAGAQAVLMPALTADGAPYIAVPPPPPSGAAGSAAAGPGSQPAEPQQQLHLPPPLQAKWGYSLAPAEVMQAVIEHPFVRLPGVLLACKRLADDTVLPPPRLPERLRWSGVSGLDAKRLLREGWLASTTSPVRSGTTAAAAAVVAAARPLLAPAAGCKPGRPPKSGAAAPKKEPQMLLATTQAPASPGWLQAQQQRLTCSAAAAPAAAGTPAQQQQQQWLAYMYQQQVLAQQAVATAQHQEQQQQQKAVPPSAAYPYQQALLQQQQLAILQQQQPEVHARLVAQYQQQAAATAQQQAVPSAHPYWQALPKQQLAQQQQMATQLAPQQQGQVPLQQQQHPPQ